MSFHSVSPGIRDAGKIGNVGKPVLNAFTLQMNSQYFKGSPVCAGSGKPAKCEAWQQFLYFDAGRTGEVFMQYWRLSYYANAREGGSDSAVLSVGGQAVLVRYRDSMVDLARLEHDRVGSVRRRRRRHGLLLARYLAEGTDRAEGH